MSIPCRQWPISKMILFDFQFFQVNHRELHVRNQVEKKTPLGLCTDEDEKNEQKEICQLNKLSSMIICQAIVLDFVFLGLIDVFLDRRLTRDDARGLGQGVLDNRAITRTFQLLFERRHTVCTQNFPNLFVFFLFLPLSLPIEHLSLVIQHF